MPRRKRAGDWAIFYAEVPTWLKAAIEIQAKEHHHSATAEFLNWAEKCLTAKSKAAGKAKAAEDKP